MATRSPATAGAIAPRNATRPPYATFVGPARIVTPSAAYADVGESRNNPAPQTIARSIQRAETDTSVEFSPDGRAPTRAELSSADGGARGGDDARPSTPRR